MKLLLVRHAQSKENAIRRLFTEEEYAAKLGRLSSITFDSQLSEEGVAACKSTKIQCPELGLVVASPLRRAMQTASLLFSGSGVPMVIQPLARQLIESTADFVIDFPAAQSAS